MHQKKLKGTNSDNEDDNNLREEIKQSRKYNDKFYMKRFKQCKRLSEHCQFLSKLLQHAPEDFKNIYVYKLKDMQSMIWQRCCIREYQLKLDAHDKRHDQQEQPDANLIVEVEHQNAAKDVELLELNTITFLLDQNVLEQVNDSPEDWPSVKQKRMNKKGFKI